MIIFYGCHQVCIPLLLFYCLKRMEDHEEVFCTSYTIHLVGAGWMRHAFLHAATKNIFCKDLVVHRSHQFAGYTRNELVRHDIKERRDRARVNC